MSRWITNYIEPTAPPTVYEITDALDAAANLIGPELSKGNAVNWTDSNDAAGMRDLCLCIVAAITAASRTRAIRDECVRAVRHAIDPRWRSIEAYNDHPRTTVSDAIQALRTAKAFVGTVAAA